MKKKIAVIKTPVKQTELPIQGDTGAGAALRALELRELEERNHVADCKVALEKAIANRDRRPNELDGEDFNEKVHQAEYAVSKAKEQHLLTCNALLRFDKSVADDKRDSGEKVTRAEMERIISMFTTYDRQASETFITSMCGNMLKCKTPEELHKLWTSEYKSTKILALQSAVREGHLPLWIQLAVENEL